MAQERERERLNEVVRDAAINGDPRLGDAARYAPVSPIVAELALQGVRHDAS